MIARAIHANRRTSYRVNNAKGNTMRMKMTLSCIIATIVMGGFADHGLGQTPGPIPGTWYTTLCLASSTVCSLSTRAPAGQATCLGLTNPTTCPGNPCVSCDGSMIVAARLCVAYVTTNGYKFKHCALIDPPVPCGNQNTANCYWSVSSGGCLCPLDGISGGSCTFQQCEGDVF